MKLLMAPDETMVPDSMAKIFLAGCANTDWRKEFVKYFEGSDVTIYDPKRDNWDDMTVADSIEQVSWEYDKLRQSHVIVFLFNSGSVCPITLLEYGMWGLSRGTPIAVCIMENYEKTKDIEIQTKLARPDVRITRDLYELSYETKRKLERIKQWVL